MHYWLYYGLTLQRGSFNGASQWTAHTGQHGHLQSHQHTLFCHQLEHEFNCVTAYYMKNTVSKLSVLYASAWTAYTRPKWVQMLLMQIICIYGHLEHSMIYVSDWTAYTRPKWVQMLLMQIICIYGPLEHSIINLSFTWIIHTPTFVNPPIQDSDAVVVHVLSMVWWYSK